MTDGRGRTALAIAFGVVASLVVLEATLRLFRGTFAPLVNADRQPCLYVRDDRIGFRFRPDATGVLQRYFEIDNVVRTNSAGFHDVERGGDREKGERTILAVGDSFTAAIHVPLPDTWTQVLERELGDASVVNLGLSATGTDVHLELLREQLATHDPDIVLLVFYENDAQDVERPRRFAECYREYVLFYYDDEQRAGLMRYVDEHRPAAWARWLFRTSFSVRLLSHFLNPHDVLLSLNRLGPADIGGTKPEVAPGERRSLDQILEEFLTLSRQRGFRLLVIPVPTKNAPWASLDVLSRNLSPGCLEQLEVVDVVPGIRALLTAERTEYRDLFWKYDGHFNARGNRAFALAVARILRSVAGVDSAGAGLEAGVRASVPPAAGGPE